jgi:hypothetical protein
MGTGGSFPGVKRQRCEADHSPSPSAEVKEGGAIPPLSHVSSRHSDLTKHRDNFKNEFTVTFKGMQSMFLGQTYLKLNAYILMENTFKIKHE